MNEFTKEELEQLKCSYRHYCSERPYEDWYETSKKLYSKIQSMIDNYCEHKNTSCDCELRCHDCELRCHDCGRCISGK